MGPEENILNFKRNDLVEFRKQFYIPSRTVMAISGNFDIDTVYDSLVNKFKKPTKYTVNRSIKIGHTLNIKKIDKQTIPYVYIKENYDISQTHIVMAFRTHSMHHKNNESLELIENLLSVGSSSRLYDLLRNKMGVTYFNSSDNIAYSDEGAFVIHIGVDNERVAEVIKAVLKELSNIKKHGITRNEYNKIKKLKNNSFLLSLQDPRDYMRYYGMSEVYSGIDIPNKNKIERSYLIEDRLKSFANITKEAIEDTIRNTFIKENLNIFVYGHFKDKSKIDECLDVLD